jgi:SAM-dependent methyltransferase
MSASFWYKLAQNLLSEENSLVSRRVRNSLRFSPLYLYLGMKQALATIEAEFSNIRFPKLELEVDRRDEMYMHDHPEHYFYVAYSALACIQGLRTNQSGETFTSILDLPCGHGRVLRALKAAFPKANFTACDLDEHGVDFCVRKFGATGAYSDVDPRKIRIQAKFDLIWVGSLFTHLNGDRWSSFLNLFSSILAKDGILFFSTHGDFVVGRLERFPKFYGLSPEQIEMVKLQYSKGGFGYADYRKNPGYGISLSSAEWVKKLLMLSSFDLAAFIPTAWDKHHDVWAVKPKIVEPTLTAQFDWVFQRPRHCAKYRAKFYAK